MIDSIMMLPEVLLRHDEPAAGTLVDNLHVVLVLLLHHLGQCGRLVGKGFANGRHELRILGYGREASLWTKI